METGYLNFHDEEHFSDFSLSLEHHDSLEESSNSLMAIVENDFDYAEAQLDTSGGLWGTEQELNGDMAVLPVSGVASVIPKIENIKEDFAKVLTDWHEHIGYLQASDMEEDIDMHLPMSIPEKLQNIPDEIFTKETPKSPVEQTSLLSTPKKSKLSINIKKETPTLSCVDEQSMRNALSKLPDSPGKLFESSPLKNSIKIEIKDEPLDIPEDIDPAADSDDCVDIETVPEEVPVLEAGDVKSLLEQFEASEATVLHQLPSEDTKTQKINKQSSTKERFVQDESKKTLLKKSTDSSALELHKNIRDSLPKEVVDRIKASARNKVISVIPALNQKTNKNGTRMQEAAATLSRNKLLKLVKNNTSPRIEGSVQLDHDYCSSTSSISSTNSPNTSDKTTGNYLVRKTMDNNHRLSFRKNLMKRESWADSSSKKDSGLESGDVSDASEETQIINQTDNNIKNKELLIAQSNSNIKSITDNNVNNNLNINKSCNLNGKTVITTIAATTTTTAATVAPVYEMKIRSALATSILQLRRGVLTKTKSIDNAHKGKQMISVLKKPPIINNQLPINPNESIVTTKNSSNDEIKNIIVQDTMESISIIEDEKKPPRRKLNLAEYRSRREQTRSDNSRTCSPVQPMTLVYIHHASTTTEPIKDDPDNPVWSEREIVSVLKPKADVEEDKIRVKPATREISIQTNETVFDNTNFNDGANIEIIETNNGDVDMRVGRIHDRKRRSYRQRRNYSSSRSSRSRSRSRSLGGDRRRRGRSESSSSRSRSRSSSSSSSSSSRSRSRSISRRRNTRRRRISHRRSSVSSNSSWSSRSRSSYRSRSRSRSSRSRSPSSGSSRSSRYSSCSRYSSRSNSRRKWSCRPRFSRNEKRHYDRRRRGSSGSSRDYRVTRRSPYRRPYDGWYNKEKKRQVEERRVIYVGRLADGISKAELRRRFEAFGPVLDISLHFREHGDNYGFVTFAYKNDAYEAVEHGNDDINMPRYDLCFGGRRAFCKVKYADLDGMATNQLGSGGRSIMKNDEDNTFDLLLKEAKAKLRKRKV